MPSSFFIVTPSFNQLAYLKRCQPSGELITYWKSLPLRRAYLDIGTLYNLTCAMFFRCRVFRSRPVFDDTLRAVADWVMMRRLIREGARAACLPEYLTTYTYAPENISNQALAQAERRYHGDTVLPARRALARIARAAERAWRGTRRQQFALA